MTTKYTMKEASERLEVSVDILRRMCDSGMIPRVRRNRLGRRVLEEWQFERMSELLKLRQSGMQRAELKRYAALLENDSTARERKAMLETQKRQLWTQLEGIRDSIDILERQIDVLDQEIINGN